MREPHGVNQMLEPGLLYGRWQINCGDWPTQWNRLLVLGSFSTDQEMLDEGPFYILGLQTLASSMRAAGCVCRSAIRLRRVASHGGIGS